MSQKSRAEDRSKHMNGPLRGSGLLDGTSSKVVTIYRVLTDPMKIEYFCKSIGIPTNMPNWRVTPFTCEAEYGDDSKAASTLLSYALLYECIGEHCVVFANSKTVLEPGHGHYQNLTDMRLSYLYFYEPEFFDEQQTDTALVGLSPSDETLLSHLERIGFDSAPHLLEVHPHLQELADHIADCTGEKQVCLDFTTENLSGMILRIQSGVFKNRSKTVRIEDHVVGKIDQQLLRRLATKWHGGRSSDS